MERHGLYRSRTDRVFGGVAAGIARSLNVETVIIRIIFALLLVFGGGGLLLYLILWIAIPEEPISFYQVNSESADASPLNEEATPESAGVPPVYPARKNNGALIGGLILIAIGALFLIDRLLPNIHFRFQDFWPIIIVIAGIVLIYSSFTGIKNQQK
jgi:phage shock protein C